jgi:hypothetical protein
MGRRTVLLFDPHSHPQSWNERMVAGEFAVLYSQQLRAPVESFIKSQLGPVCDLFSSLPEAEQYARQQVAIRPLLRCRIYGIEGLGGQPLMEIAGKLYRGESEISSRFRRWGGSILLAGGLTLICFDYLHNFDLSWPATIGIRALPAGLILLVTEAVIVWEARRKLSRQEVQ